MPLDWIARILEQLCDVLEERHRKIVHRDLKPANLMLLEGRPVGREQLQVLDFGIAKILEAESDTADVHTHTGSFREPAPYTSPEQASRRHHRRPERHLFGRGHALRDDDRPPAVPAITRLIYDHLYTAPPPFVERNPECQVPAEVEAVVLRCLAKNPGERPQTALALFEQFHAAIRRNTSRRLPPHRARPLSFAVGPANVDTPKKGAGGTFRRPAHPGVDRSRGRVPYRYPNLPSPPTPRVRGSRPFKNQPRGWNPPTGVMLHLAWSRSKRGAATHLDESACSSSLRPWPCWEAGVPTPSSTGKSSRPPPPGFPEGYVAAEGSKLINGHPSLLIRQRDNTEFILIEGGSFKMGNDGFDNTAGPNDEDQPAHQVVLSDFSMQATEVTNGEMEAYFNANHVNVADRPKRWKTACERIERSGTDPKLYPATGIPYELAEKYAKSVRGRLPTEAEWEYAARSRGKPYPYVWGLSAKPDLSQANVDSKANSVRSRPPWSVSTRRIGPSKASSI